MARVFITAFVQVATRELAETLVEPYLVSPNAPGIYMFSVPLVPSSSPADAVPTAWGVCSAVDSAGELATALPQLAAAVPGTQYAVVSPWRIFNRTTHWVNWLASFGLKERREAV